jgi:hypothetical protein
MRMSIDELCSNSELHGSEFLHDVIPLVFFWCPSQLTPGMQGETAAYSA